MNLKEIFYDWGGINTWLFHFINGKPGQPAFYDSFVLLLDKIGDHHMFPYYFAIVAACGIVSLIGRKFRKLPVERRHIFSWLALLAVLVISYSSMALVINMLKTMFGFPRPYVVFGEAIRLLETPEAGKNYASFPSGHVAFTVMMIAALWPKLRGNLRPLGCLFILLMMWSRVAMGVHFPADTFWSLFISLFIVIFFRRIIYRSVGVLH